MRDDFSQQTLDTLAKRVGVRCSNPSCRKLTTGPRSDSTKIINIGVGAHITAASENGPRYNPNLSSQERNSAENGIWLCQNCAKLIDNDPDKYTVEIIKEWKRKAENAASAEIEGPSVAESVLDDLINLEIDYKKIKMESERHDYSLKLVVQNLSDKVFENYHIDIEFPTVVLEAPEQNAYYIPARSDSQTSFFRITNKIENITIYPGDTRTFQPFQYYMNHDIYWHRGDLFNFIVFATMFHEDSKLVIEKKFEELQFF